MYIYREQDGWLFLWKGAGQTFPWYPISENALRIRWKETLCPCPYPRQCSFLSQVTWWHRPHCVVSRREGFDLIVPEPWKRANQLVSERGDSSKITVHFIVTGNQGGVRRLRSGLTVRRSSWPRLPDLDDCSAPRLISSHLRSKCLLVLGSQITEVQFEFQ